MGGEVRKEAAGNHWRLWLSREPLMDPQDVGRYSYQRDALVLSTG